MDSSLVTVKGQIVIPAKLRKKMGIRKGTRVFLEEKNGEIIIHPVTAGFYERTFGLLKGGGLLKELGKKKREEKGHEEKKIEKR